MAVTLQSNQMAAIKKVASVREWSCQQDLGFILKMEFYFMWKV